MTRKRVLRLGEVRRDVDEELAYHFERTVSELVEGGMNERDARAEATRRFGDESHYRRELETIDRSVAAQRRWAERLEAVRQSIGYALRTLRRSPGLSLGVILAFALGIGANLTMYGVVERLLLRPPAHVEAADGVKRIYLSEYVSFMGERYTTPTLSYPAYRQLQEARSLTAVAAWAPNAITVGEGLEAEEREAVFATGNLFGLLGVEPAAGRFFTAAEDRIGGPQQAVLGWEAWQRDYAGSRNALGQTIDFGYGPYVIVGVAPRGFTGVDLMTVDVWLPFHVVTAQTSGTEWEADHGWQFFEAVARLEAGTAEAAAATEATALYRRGREGTEFASQDAEGDPRILLSSVLSARGPEAPPESVVARLLLIVSAIVLLIASLNVANLLLARSLRQRREIAVRLALGISRRRLVGQIVLDGVILAFAGGLAALLLAMWGTRVVGNVLIPGLSWEGTLNLRVLGTAAALSLLAGAAAGIIPALQATRGGVAETLRQAGAGAVGRRATRTRAALALVQTALSVLLLVGAGLFVRSLDRVRGLDYGFEPENLVFAVPRAIRGAMADEDWRQLSDRARDRLARLPGVHAVGASHTLPFHSSRSVRLRAQGVDSMPTPATGGPYVFEVTPGYIEAMGLELLAGRSIEENDAGAGAWVAVINESLAASLWPGESALGKCLYVGGTRAEPQTRCSEVVGVVEDAHGQQIDRGVTFQYFVPMAQRQIGDTPRIFVVRTADESGETIGAIHGAILELDPRIRFATVEPLMNRIDPRTRSWQLGAAVFSIFGLLALVVAAIGLYSVLAFDVAQRTREIGVRSALGASSRTLVGMVVSRSLRLTAVGVTIGVLAALVLVQRVEPMLFEIPPRDPVTFAGVVLVLHLVAALASTLPAWKASRVDPNVALRAD